MGLKRDLDDLGSLVMILMSPSPWTLLLNISHMDGSKFSLRHVPGVNTNATTSLLEGWPDDDEDEEDEDAEPEDEDPEDPCCWPAPLAPPCPSASSWHMRSSSTWDSFLRP
jgi:hypothetical protein